MRYIFTLNMPSKGGNPIHQVIGEHPAANLHELMEAMEGADFLLVEEYYIERDHMGEAGLTPHGFIAINPMIIGKIKEAEDRPHRR